MSNKQLSKIAGKIINDMEDQNVVLGLVLEPLRECVPKVNADAVEAAHDAVRKSLIVLHQTMADAANASSDPDVVESGGDK